MKSRRLTVSPFQPKGRTMRSGDTPTTPEVSKLSLPWGIAAHGDLAEGQSFGDQVTANGRATRAGVGSCIIPNGDELAAHLFGQSLNETGAEETRRIASIEGRLPQARGILKHIARRGAGAGSEGRIVTVGAALPVGSRNSSVPRRNAGEAALEGRAVGKLGDARAIERREGRFEELVTEDKELVHEDFARADVGLIDVIDEGEGGQLARRIRLERRIERGGASQGVATAAAAELGETNQADDSESMRMSHGVRLLRSQRVTLG